MILLPGVSKWSKTTGWCLDCNGVDQNEGTTQFNGLGEDACINKCSEINEAKGCEYSGIWAVCAVHTNEVSRGSGNAGYKCWTALNNCPGKSYDFIVFPALIPRLRFLLENLFHL